MDPGTRERDPIDEGVRWLFAAIAADGDVDRIARARVELLERACEVGPGFRPLVIDAATARLQVALPPAPAQELRDAVAFDYDRYFGNWFALLHAEPAGHA